MAGEPIRADKVGSSLDVDSAEISFFGSKTLSYCPCGFAPARLPILAPVGRCAAESLKTNQSVIKTLIHTEPL